MINIYLSIYLLTKWKRVREERDGIGHGCTVYSVQCTVYSVQCTVYSVHRENEKFLNVLFSKKSFNTTQFCIIQIKCFFNILKK